MSNIVPPFTVIPSDASPDTFLADGIDFLGELPAFVAGVNGFADLVNARSSDASATTQWISSTDYTEGQGVFSPADKKTYRAKNDVENSVTDPSADATNFEVAGGVSAADQTKLSNITVTEAVNLDTLARKRTRVADGVIANRALWVRQSDGTAKAVTQEESALSIGDDVVFNAGSTRPYIRGIVDIPGTNKMLVSYIDVANSHYGTAVVATIAGDEVAFGTPAVFSASITGFFISGVYLPEEDKIALAFTDNGDANNLKVVIATVSGTSVSFGSVVSSGVEGRGCVLTYDTGLQKAVLNYTNGFNRLQGSVISVSGTTPAISTAVQASTTKGSLYGSIFDATSGKHLSILGGSTNLMAFLGTGSGTTISWGSVQSLLTVDTYSESGDLAYSTVDGKYLLAYRNDSDSDHGYVVVITVSGSTVTAGTPVKFEAAASLIYGCEYVPSDDAFYVVYGDAGNSGYMTMCRVTISGTVPTPETPAVIRSVNVGVVFCGTGLNSSNEKILVGFRDGSNSDYGTGFVIAPPGLATNVADWAGFAFEAGADGEAFEVSTPGDIIDGLTGLTYDAEYYPEADGTLTVTSNLYGKIGRAISTTEIIQTGPVV